MLPTAQRNPRKKSPLDKAEFHSSQPNGVPQATVLLGSASAQSGLVLGECDDAKDCVDVKRTRSDLDLWQANHSLARIILFSFLLTFISARVVVFLIMSRRIPDLYLRLGGTHIHHLNYGIFLLAGIGAYLLLSRPEGRRERLAAVLYGIGLGLTFDEFGMWVRLGGSYWQRASVDAVGVLAAVFGLIAYALKLRDFRPQHWGAAAGLAVVVSAFFVMLIESFHFAHKIIGPKLYQIEANSPP
jgi:hypothetical protein